MGTGDSEKVSINCGAVDLGHIDLLVEQGLYSNRSDFFRTATRNQLKAHENFFEQQHAAKTIAVGVTGYSREDLEELAAANQRLSVSMIGMVYIANDVTPELALATIDRIKVHGIFRASPEVRAALKGRIFN